LVHALVVVQSFGWRPTQRLLHGVIGLMGGDAVRRLNTATNLIP